MLKKKGKFDLEIDYQQPPTQITNEWEGKKADFNM